jgi:hypothetical protein
VAGQLLKNTFISRADTSGVPVIQEQAGSLNAVICITLLPEVPHLEQQAIPRAAIPNCTNHFSA